MRHGGFCQYLFAKNRPRFYRFTTAFWQLELPMRRFAWRRWLAVPLESLTYSCLTSPLRSIINACVSFSANVCINITSFDVAAPVRHLNTPHCHYKIHRAFCQAKREPLTLKRGGVRIWSRLYKVKFLKERLHFIQTYDIICVWKCGGLLHCQFIGSA